MPPKKVDGPSKYELIRERDELIEKSKQLVQAMQGAREAVEAASREKAGNIMRISQLEVELQVDFFSRPLDDAANVR
jgi:hypothetical protein